MERMSVEEAAAAMGKPPMWLRMALRQDKFEWGVAVKMRKQYSYWINAEKFNEFMGVSGPPPRPEAALSGE